MKFTQCGPPFENSFQSTAGNGYRVTKHFSGNWRAYFKPCGWSDFGNSCEIKHGISKVYTNKADAIGACERHYKAFGDAPGDLNRLSEEEESYKEVDMGTGSFNALLCPRCASSEYTVETADYEEAAIFCKQCHWPLLVFDLTSAHKTLLRDNE